MRDDAIASEAASGPSEIESRRWLAACVRVAFWNRGRLGLLLALAILIPWPPWSRSLTAKKPSRCASGTTRCPIVSLAFGRRRADPRDDG